MKAEINVEFNEATDRQVIQSGEEIKTLFGKLKKWLTDLKPVAFSGSYNDLSDTPDVVTEAHIAPIKSQCALNRTTLGMQRKNLLKNMAVSTSYNDVKFTVNSDGTVDVSSTAVSTGTRFLMIDTFNLEPGSYVLTGADSLANYGDIRAYINDVVYKHNEPFTLNETSTVIVRICVYINRNLPDTVRVYPMIRCTAISDSTYEPYQPSLKEELDSLKTYIDQKIAEISGA